MNKTDFFNERHRVLFEVIQQHAREIMMSDRSYSPDLSPIRKRSISPTKCRKGETRVLPSERFCGNKTNYDELAERNAQQLIKQEEEAKLKSEKKRAKKEREKQKKKEIQPNNSKSHNNSDNIINKASSEMDNLTLNSDKDTDVLDLSAAFVSKAVKKVINTTAVPELPKQKKEIKDVNSIINDAINYEKSNNYKEAVLLLSEAINLSPRRIDLILKRSHLYYELAKFEKSIQDSQKVLQYSPNNADAHYRLGEAHFALNNLAEAETAFENLLSLNSHCDESKNRLFSIRIKQLEGMGYHPNEAFTALFKSKNKLINEAVDFLTSLENGEEITEEIYYSDEDESEEEEQEQEEDYKEESDGARENLVFAASKPIITVDNKSKLLIDPSNPLKCCSLFVGNLKEGITCQELHCLFTKFGEIESISLMEPNTYAFVNFVESTSASRAMEALQGSCWLVSTNNPLTIKYPTNVINSIIRKLKDPELMKKYITPRFKPTPKKQPFVNKGPAGARPRATPKTEECFYWRNTGCSYGNQCSYLHIPGHKGIDFNT
uniref:C3H1-type domain-containing protein n=1 Tax=Graphocephala atropunctata TaxID=36148 RepID=A0A1B6MQ56_9HEMI